MLWPDWYGPELVDVWWICEQFTLGRSWVQNHVTKRDWFPAEIAQRRKETQWPGDPRSRVWLRIDVEQAMAAHGYGPECIGLTAKELALKHGVAYQTVIGWSNTFDDFPAPAVRDRPRRWEPERVDRWLEVRGQHADPWFGGSLRNGTKRERTAPDGREDEAQDVA